MKKLLTIYSKGEGYSADIFENTDGSGQFTGDMDIDIDGSPDWGRDPSGQPDTTLHESGHAINGQEFPFIVLPPEVIVAFSLVILGCKAVVRYRGKISDAVVADVGPHRKLGEGSPKLARNLGINDDPNHGGVDTPEVVYQFWPGVPAVLRGITFELQTYHHG